MSVIDPNAERRDGAPAPHSLMARGEKLLSLAAVAASLPGHRGNAHVNPSTLFRWIVKGLRLPGGEVARLEAVKVGVAWRTSLEAIERFSARLTDAAVNPADTAPAPTPAPAARKHAAAKASRQADQIFGAATASS
jgi:hypothetical protein